MESSVPSAQVIQDFLRDHSDKGAGTSLNLALEEKRKVLRCCHEVLSTDDGKGGDHKERLSALTAIKVLSRDKENVNELMDAATMDLLLHHAGINPNSKRKNLDEESKEEVSESQRCLNNLLLQSSSARSLCSGDRALPGLIALVEEWSRAAPDSRPFPAEMLTIDVKLLFLITALSESTRTKVLLDLDGGRYLLGLLQTVLDEAIARGTSSSKEASAATPPKLTESEVSLTSEVLKALFNVTLGVEELLEPLRDETSRSAIEGAIGRACGALKDFFAVGAETEKAKKTLDSNCTNLLANVPPSLAGPLLEPPSPSLLAPGRQPIIFDGACVDAPRAMLDMLLGDVRALGETSVALREAITPALSVLCNLSRKHRPVRKYLRSVILPPLRDVSTRPEEGDTPRNRLCKLLTSPVDAVATLVAELLFVLCKESVARMVKYTGYGNAAGLLARRGLMLGGRGAAAGDYSDEEDSDTEEYSENAHRVNPIVGCVEPERPSPFEGMTEEQKEHEAMKLVNLINDMHNLGVVKPAMPGPDGRPRQLEHVLQLQEAAQAQAGASANQEEESDSD